MKYLKIVCLLLLSFNVYGQGQNMGNEGGNGGDVMICYDQERSEFTSTLLDYFELTGLDLGQETEAFAKVREILTDLKRIDPIRASVYLTGLENFQEEMVFYPGRLRDIQDEGSFPRGTSCVPRQAAIQMKSVYRDDYTLWSKVQKGRYTFDSIVWEMMNENSRAGLILHELIYREAINHIPAFPRDSRNVRILNRIWAGQRKTLTQFAYDDSLIALGFPVLK